MLPELALGTARVAREIAPGPASAELIDAMLIQTGLFLQFIVECHDALGAKLDGEGIDPDVLATACRNSLETLDGVAATRGTLAGRLITDKQKRESQRQEDTASKMRRTFTEWLESANRPSPPIDLKKLEEDYRADLAAGRMIRVETFDDLFPSDSEGD